jgi:hypothetical protein
MRAKRQERETGLLNLCWMDDTVIAKMRARVAQCRRLAATITDAQAARILRQMADEGEADIKRLESHENGEGHKG